MLWTNRVWYLTSKHERDLRDGLRMIVTDLHWLEISQERSYWRKKQGKVGLYIYNWNRAQRLMFEHLIQLTQGSILVASWPSINGSGGWRSFIGTFNFQEKDWPKKVWLTQPCRDRWTESGNMSNHAQSFRLHDDEGSRGNMAQENTAPESVVRLG